MCWCSVFRHKIGLQTRLFKFQIFAKKIVRSASGEVIGTVFYFALIAIVQLQSPQIAGAKFGMCCGKGWQVEFLFRCCLAVVSK
jgi:hypothetical protein